MVLGQSKEHVPRDQTDQVSLTTFGLLLYPTNTFQVPIQVNKQVSRFMLSTVIKCHFITQFKHVQKLVQPSQWSALFHLLHNLHRTKNTFPL